MAEDKTEQPTAKRLHDAREKGQVARSRDLALAAGAASESQPEDKPYGHRNAGVVDPNGVTWWIAAPVK